jgi:hypothetical protein
MRIDDFNYFAAADIVDEYLGLATPGAIELCA